MNVECTRRTLARRAPKASGVGNKGRREKLPLLLRHPWVTGRVRRTIGGKRRCAVHVSCNSDVDHSSPASENRLAGHPSQID